MSDRQSLESLPQKENNLFVVGIGASAGGLRALEEFFENMPTNSGATFVVIQHLSPDFKSLMKELLERRTRMEIYRVTEGMVLEPNSIYLIPPGKNLVVANQKLHLFEQEERNRHGVNFPIDIFLESLAKNYQERSFGIILSGTGSDGTNGLRAISEAGGLVMVQDPATAEFDGMPRTAIATGVVDRILSPQALAQEIYQFLRSPIDPTQARHNQEASFDFFKLQRIASILAKHEQVDFSHYKPSTLSRRIHRRCLISGCNNLDDYIRLLEISAEERTILRQDLLISVTQFFRDSEAWQFLETQAIPQLIEQAKPGEELRCWVTACATGEEAYSLAILLDETMEKLDKQVRFKIFATDIDKQALEKATQGIYSETIANDMSADRLQRYFIRREPSYQVIRKLREKLLFAPHDLTKDAGFTRMNLISCRNVLIYMQPDLQQQVLRNAIKFTEQGSVTFRVGYIEDFPGQPQAVASQCSATQLRFQIEDTGIGIPAEQFDQIFLPFEQLDRWQSSSEGTGLGLSISQNIVRLLGTEIQVDSTVGRGSLFGFDLNLPEVENLKEIAPEISECHVIGYRGEPRLILVADDRADNREVLVNFLQSLGFGVLEASSGKEAVAQALQTTPDFVVLDWIMPGMDGLEVTRRLRQEPRLQAIPIAIVSASMLLEDPSACWQAGCNAFLPKPLHFADLLALLEEYLDLEWIVPEGSADSVAIIALPLEELEGLLELAMQGDIRGILDRVTRLEAQTDLWSPFVRDVRQLAESFQVDRLQEFLRDAAGRSSSPSEQDFEEM
jgi:chemotaxis methyl-accepting protein methylase/chemotaxis response regulator CheB